MAHLKPPKKIKAADINVVPLIDIVLVLLIIFMVITPLLVSEMDISIPDIDVNTPEPTPTPDVPPVPQVTVQMTKELITYIGREAVARNELQDRLTRILQGRALEEKIVFFDAQDDTNYGESVKVLDIIRGAGAYKIGLITDRTNQCIPPTLIPPACTAEGAPGVPGAPPGAPGLPPAPPGKSPG